MIKFYCYLVSLLFLLSSCSEEKISNKPDSKQLIVISEKLEEAFWRAEDKRIADASNSKGQHSKWEDFEKEHEVKIVGVHTSQDTPPVFTGIIRLLIPSIKDSYYEFQFEYTKEGWISTEAYIVAPNRSHNFYKDPFPNSKSLKEYLPAELKKLGAQVIIE